jgi:hypothetical protein
MQDGDLYGGARGDGVERLHFLLGHLQMVQLPPLILVLGASFSVRLRCLLFLSESLWPTLLST